MRIMKGGIQARRRAGAAVAFLLSLVGVMTLLWFVQGADDRALDAYKGVTVYIVDGNAAVEPGTPIEDIPVEVRSIPATGVVPNAVRDLGSVAGLVNAVELLPGDQLRIDRLIPFTEVVEEDVIDLGPTSPLLPPGYLEVTIPVAADRALGGRLVPGESVAIIASFSGADDPAERDENGSIIETPDVPAIDPPAGAVLAFIELQNNETISLPVEFQNAPLPQGAAPRDGESTHIFLDRVLVTAIQADDFNPPDLSAAVDAVNDDDDDETAVPDTSDANPYEQSATPGGDYLISFALPAADVERIVFAAEWGSIWLARNPDTAPAENLHVQRLDSIYETTTKPAAP